MRLLIDSQILLWAIVAPERLPARVATALIDGENAVWASAIGVAELRIKQRIGKLELPDDFDDLIEKTGFEVLPFRAEHTALLAELPLHHRDPFDRMIIAQAIREGLTVATTDAAFASYPVALLPA